MRLWRCGQGTVAVVEGAGSVAAQGLVAVGDGEAHQAGQVLALAADPLDAGAGAEVLAVGTPDSPAGLETALASQLRRRGLADPAVAVRIVREPGRLASGKTQRFIAMPREV
jgi:hypothetical protein